MQPSWSTTMASEALGSLYVVAQSADQPTDAEWDVNVERQASLVSSGLRVLVWSEGGGPNAKQRARLSAKMQGLQPPTAILTSSTLARAIGIAISWVNPSVRMFHPDALEAAMDHLEIAPGARPHVVKCLARVRAKVGQQTNRLQAG